MGFYKHLTHIPLFSPLFPGIIGADQGKEVLQMTGFYWNSRTDLEDLIYEDQNTVASER